MGDVGDTFNYLRKLSQERRENNRNNSAKLLREAGITFQTYNLGAHLIIPYKNTFIDFWPGTGKFIVRGTGKYRRGVFNLIKLFKETDNETD